MGAGERRKRTGTGTKGEEGPLGKGRSSGTESAGDDERGVLRNHVPGTLLSFPSDGAVITGGLS